MPGINKARIHSKDMNKLLEDVFTEAHLVIESPVMPVNQFVEPLLTR
jgi:hypothetical protein